MKRTVTIDGSSVSRKRSRSAARSRRPSIAAQVKRVLEKRVETKFHDLGSLVALYPAGGYTSVLNSIASGDDYNERTGRHLTGKYLMIDLLIQPNTIANAGAGLSADAGFVAIVFDRQANTATASFNNIFASTGAGQGQVFPNVASDRDRYKVLKLEHYYCQPKYTSAGTLLGGSFQDIKGMKRRWFIPLRDIDIEYASASSSVPSHGSILICWGSNLADTANGTCSIQWASRFAFTDM